MELWEKTPMRFAEAFLGTSLLAAATVLSLAPGAGAQTPGPASEGFVELTANLARLRDAALTSDYAWRQVAYLTQNVGPRLAGSRQAEAAVNYVAEELRRLGLEVTLQKVMVPHWVRGEEKAELTIYPGHVEGAAQKIVLTALGNSAATPADGIAADMVVVNDLDELAALGRDKIAGRI